MATPTKNSFDLLLARLDPDADKAAAKYEELRLKLGRYFVWSCGCPESRADALSDETLDRVAIKLEQGTVIENLRAYALATARYIWLEHLPNLPDDSWGDKMPDVPDKTQEIEEPDDRYRCLEKCLDEAIKDESDRKLILAYYDAAEGEKNKDHRKKLAQSYGVEVNNLKVRACRLRKDLEKCIHDCLQNKTADVTK